MKTSTSSNFLRQLLVLLCAAILPALLATSANAQTTIVGWDFNGLSGYGSSPQAPGSKDANVTAVGLTRSGLGTSGSAASNAWGGTGNGSATFTVKANAGYTLSLSQISAYNVRRSSSGATTGQWAYSLDGTTFVNIGSAITWGSTTSGSGNAQTAITLSGISALQNLPDTTTVTFRVTLTGATTGTWYLNQFQAGDDFVVTGTVSAAQTGPSINTTGSLTPFSTESGIASAAQTFSATGANLTQDITVTAPTDFEVATDGATFGDTATITQSGGSASGTVSVRIKASATIGAKSGNIVLSSTGATDVNVPVSGTVTAAGTPLVNLSTSSISNLSTSVGVASAVTNYLVTGTNLGTTAVTITPSEAFLEIGTNGSTFASTIDLSPTDGAVSNTVFLRVAATNAVTNYNATISHVSGSASNSLAVSGAITNLPPVLAVSTNTLSGFTTTTNVASTAQTFTVTGSNLTTNVTVGAPTGFEVANDGTTWGTNTSLTPISGSVSNTISVRLGATNVAGTPAGNVTVASGATNRSVAVSGTVTAAASAFAQGNLVVARYGNGSATLTSAAAALSILEVTPAGSTNQVLTSLSSGGFLLTASGTGTSLGYLNTYNANLALPGYNSAVGTASVADLNTKAANIVGTNATVIGRTTFPTSGTPLPFSGNAFRSVIATDTNKFYASGTAASATGAGGIWYYDGANYEQVSTNPVSNTRNVEIYNGNLYFSTGAGTTGIYQVGSGLPTSSNQVATLVIATASPFGFAISADGNTVYVADDAAVNANLGGGIQKWTKSGASWTRQYTFASQARGLAVDFSGPNPVIYATTTEIANNKLIKITDTGSNSVATTIAEAGANFVFRGVDFTPSGSAPAPSNLTYAPSATNAVVGTAIGNLVPSVTGTVTNYSVNPALPGGLSIDGSSGVISGTPTTATASADYTVTAINEGGSTTANVTIAVDKGTPVITVPPTASGLVQGQTLAASSLTGGSASVPGSFAWDDTGITPPLGTTSYGVIFTATDAGNYNTAATTASVTVLSAYQAGYNNWLANYPSLSGANTNGTADPDSDGFNNSSEYAFGTSPIVPNGALLSTTTSNSVFRSSWAGPASGVTYGVLSTTNLATTAFTNDPTAPVLTNSGLLFFTNQATGNKFFRVRATSN